jgi:hypothetical protein
LKDKRILMMMMQSYHTKIRFSCGLIHLDWKMIMGVRSFFVTVF